jgi:hypothetical protein
MRKLVCIIKKRIAVGKQVKLISLWKRRVVVAHSIFLTNGTLVTLLVIECSI